MKELSKEDQERIEQSNKRLQELLTYAEKKGFNEALEEVKTMLDKFDIASGAHHDSEIIEEITKLKK